MRRREELTAGSSGGELQPGGTRGGRGQGLPSLGNSNNDDCSVGSKSNNSNNHNSASTYRMLPPCLAMDVVIDCL